MSADSTGVLVLGAPGGGAATVARALGGPAGAQPSEGHEVPKLRDLNEKLLADLGGSALAPPELDDGWAERAGLDARKRRGRAIVEEAFPSRAWVWADTRNSVLLPFWRATVGADLLAVLVYDRPKEVAASLAAELGLSPPMGLAVWERYLRGALCNVEGLPTLVSRHSDLVEDGEGWAELAASFLGSRGVTIASSGSVSSAPDGERPATVALSESQRELLATAESLRGTHDAFPRVELPPATDWMEALLAERRRADVMHRQMDERLRSTRRRLREERRARYDAEAERSGTPALRGALRGDRSDAPSSRRLPEFLIIGAQKSGTSSLFRYIGQSPHVELPAEKEVHFFDMNFREGVDWYASRFPPARSRGALRRRGRITGESSPYYLFHPLAPQRAKEVLPDVRLLALLRNPVERAVSHYYHEVGIGFEDLPLPVALDREQDRLAGEAERLAADPTYESFAHRHFSYQARGVYVDQLSAWRSLFGDDQLLVISSDRLFADTHAQMSEVYEFLGLPGKPPRSFEAYNQRDYPPMPAEVEERLSAHFAEHNVRLKAFLGDDFGW